MTVHQIQQDTLDLLEPFLAIKNPNHRKIVKMAEKLIFTTDKPAVRSLCHAVLRQKKPMQYIQDAAMAAQELARLIAEYTNDPEVHGLIFHHKRFKVDTYPIHLVCFRKWLYEGPWHPEQELEIMRDAGDNWRELTKINNTLVRIVLFPEFGFSGETQLVEI